MSTERAGSIKVNNTKGVVGFSPVAVTRWAPCRQSGCVAHRPRPLAQVALSATGSAPIAPPSTCKSVCTDKQFDVEKLTLCAKFLLSNLRWINEHNKKELTSVSSFFCAECNKQSMHGKSVFVVIPRNAGGATWESPATTGDCHACYAGSQ